MRETVKRSKSALRENAQRGFNEGSIKLPQGSKTAFQSQPCHWFTISYSRWRPFHGGNTGSNPVGDANHFNNLQEQPRSVRHRVRHRAFSDPPPPRRAWPLRPDLSPAVREHLATG